MDIPIKLEFKICNGYNSEKKLIEIDKLTKTNSVIIEFKEFDSVNVTSKNTLKNIKIYLETAEKKIQLNNNYESTISSFKNNSLFIPGIYRIIIVDSNKSYTYYFKILPHNMSWQQLSSLKDCLESIQKDLTRNFFDKKNKSSCDTTIEYSKYALLNYIMENSNFFINILNNIFRLPLSKLSKKYNYYNYSKKPDRKTFKKYAQYGCANRTNIFNDKHYESRFYHHYDIPENRWLYQTLLELIMILHKLKAYLIENELTLKKMYEEYNNSKIIKLSKLKTIGNSKSISSEYKNELIKSIKFCDIRISSYNKEIASIKNKQREINCVLQDLNIFLANDLFKHITNINKPIKNNIKIIKDHRYSWLYKFANELDSYNSENINLTSYYKPKPTYELFEYFCVILIIDILLDLNYIWDNGWLADSDNFQEELLEGSTLMFTKNNEKIILEYDKEIKNERTNENDCFIAINSKNRKPDIILSHFVDNMIDSAIVFEVKYRRSTYLYNKSGDTEVMKQMKNYLQFGYYNNKLNRGIIKKVITFYPMQKNLVEFCDKTYKNELEFISIGVKKILNDIEEKKYITSIIKNIFNQN